MNNKEEQKYYKFIENFRKKNVPERYNQIELLDYLLDEDVDHYISISNRSDGKSFNYIHALIKLSIDFGIRFTLLARRYTVRFAYQKFLIKILDKSKIYNLKDFMFLRTDFYITILYKDKEVGIITDLNQATDLKYHSNYLEDFPVIVYDEFLALEGDYLPDEWERLKTIYGSIDRKSEEDRPLIKFPKIIYLGNAVNFSSPVLSNLDLFNILEKHPINTIRKHDNIVLEMHKNETANEQRNLRAFNEENDSMTHGEFKTNSFNLITEKQRNALKKNARFIVVKLQDNYLKITFNEENNLILLSVIYFSEHYDFNLMLKDNTDESIYLDETFFDFKHKKRYSKEFYLFDNNFTKDLVTNSFHALNELKITKIISKYMSMNQNESNFDKKEKQYKDNYIDQTKKGLLKKFGL